MTDNPILLEDVEKEMSSEKKGWWARKPRWKKVCLVVGLTGAIVTGLILLHAYTSALTVANGRELITEGIIYVPAK